MEAVVTPDRACRQLRAARLASTATRQIVLAVSRSGERLTRSLRTIRFRPGDVIVLQGNLPHMPEALGELALPAARRPQYRARPRALALPAGHRACRRHAACCLPVVPVAFGFFGAALVLLLARSISLREAYEAIDWPLLIMIGSIIPVSEALADDRRHRSSRRAGSRPSPRRLPPLGALAVILVAGMAVTPVPEQCGDGARHGADCGAVRQRAWLQPRSFPDGRRARRRFRFPDSDRPPVEHAGDGPRRLSLRRLLAARTAALDPRRRGRRAAHHHCSGRSILDAPWRPRSSQCCRRSCLPSANDIAAVADADARRQLGALEENHSPASDPPRSRPSGRRAVP